VEAVKVTLTNQQTLAASQALAALVKVKRPMMGALKMRALARLIGAQLEDYDAERRKLLEVHGEHNEDSKLKEENGEVLFADTAAKSAFAADFGELLLATWECGATLRPRDFGGLDVEPELLVALGDLLEDDKDADEGK
jgi:hypothetical protein